MGLKFLTWCGLYLYECVWGCNKNFNLGGGNNFFSGGEVGKLLRSGVGAMT